MNNSKSIIAIVVLLAVIGFLGWFFWEILVYMFIALVLSFLGTPLMRLLAKIKIKNWQFPNSIAAVITLIVIIAAFIAVFHFLIPVVIRELTSLTSIDLTSISTTFEDWLNKLDPTLQKFGILNDNEHCATLIVNELQSYSDKINLSTIISSSFSLAGKMLIAIFSILFMTFFALKDHGIFFRMIRNWIPIRYQENYDHILAATGEQVSSYFIGVFVDMLIVGVLEVILGLIFHIPNALLIGCIGGALNIIPFVGPLIACIIGIVISLTSLIPADPESTMLVMTLIKVALVFLITKGIDDFVLQPYIYGKRTQTHPLEIFIVILIAGSIGGVAAMIFAVPAYTLLRILVKEFFGAYFSIGNEQAQPLNKQ